MTAHPVALIHGMGSSFEHNWATVGWQDLLTEAGRDVIAIELPGHGKSVARPDTHTATLIEEAAQQYGRIDAVGFSAGGIALLVAACRNPDAFGSIALLGVGDSSLADNRQVGGDWRESISAALVSDTEPGPGMPLMIRRLAQSAGNDLGAVATYVRSAQPAPYLAELRSITARCLVVEGGADMVGPADAIVATIPSCERVTLSGVDHYAIPSNFGCIDAVLRFLG